MPIGGLYQTTDYAAKAIQAQSAAGSTLGGIKQGYSQTTKEEKTAGGALGAAAGGALAGSVLGPWGTAGGAVVGLISYYM